MEPTRDRKATLVDLLDRVLDKGLILHADLIVSMAGIPLLGVNLKAALAGMETMLEYGMMEDWDEATRAWERKHREEEGPSLREEEHLVQEVFGSYYQEAEEGEIYSAWKMGHFYLTNKRFFLWKKDFQEVVFEIALESIRDLTIKKREDLTEEKSDLFISSHTGEVARVHAKNIKELKGFIEQEIKDIKIPAQEKAV